MKVRSVLNGITAVLAVGMFYTFSLCMVRDVDEEAIAEVYKYSENTADESGEAEEEEITLILPEEEIAEEETEAETDEPVPDAFSIPGGMKMPDAFPDEAELEKLSNSDGKEQIIQTSYAENHTLYSGLENREPVDSVTERTVSRTNTSAYASDGSSKNNNTYVRRNNKKVSSDNVTADDINSGNVSGNKKKKEYTPIPDFPEVSNSSVESGRGTYYGDEKANPSLYGGNEEGCGETFMAKVRGEEQEFDAFVLVCMIVANEMSPSFHVEALRAQAVAAYSYLKYHQDNGIVPTVLVKEEVPDEIKKAVSSVWGKCCRYNGRAAQTVYTASTSGFTASAEHVWGGNKVPYLKSRECPADRYDPNYGLKKVYMEDEVKAALEEELGITLSDNQWNWLRVMEYEDGNYVKSVNIDDQTVISGRTLREKVFDFGLKSASFTVEYNEGEFVFTTYGYGHGVGMSQNGANYLAKQGYSYIDILKYYFEGTTVE